VPSDCLEQLEYPLERNTYPVWTAVQFIPQFIEGLFKKIDIKEELQFLAGLR
jgi:hypothetical protein